MGDLKTPYTDPAMTAPGLDGDTITQRGTDPLIDTGGTSGLKEFWPSSDQPDPSMEGQETANPISGLPLLPSRFEPSATSEQPPDLTDRNPGTIDRQ